jgi:hypothetical protein
MRITKFIEEVAVTPYYRSAPREILKFAYAKWLFSRHRITDPVEYLKTIGIDKNTGLDGLGKWRERLEGIVAEVTNSSRNHSGVSLEDGVILYGITRALKPRYVIETGVAAGVSTSFISAALIENGSGELYSIELPPERRADGVHDDGSVYDWYSRDVGWAIPDDIRRRIGSRHTLILQDVRTALPELLARLPWVDIFFHDDLHTPDHMIWEFEQVWPRLRPTGILIADDVNYGWIQFCRGVGMGAGSLCNLQRLASIRK